MERVLNMYTLDQVKEFIFMCMELGKVAILSGDDEYIESKVDAFNEFCSQNKLACDLGKDEDFVMRVDDMLGPYGIF